MLQDKRQTYEKFLDSVEILTEMDNDEKAAIADALQVQYYEAGSNIIAQGQPGESFYIVEDGEVETFKDGTGLGPVVADVAALLVCWATSN